MEMRNCYALWVAPLLLLTPGCRTTSDGASVAKDASDASAAATQTDDDGPFDPQTANQIEALFQQVVDRRSPPGTTGVKRAVFLKPHGCAQAQFTIPSDLPAGLQQGIFATPGTHNAWVRMSSDTDPATSDFNNNTIGFAVKVLDVPGPKVLPGEETFQTQDFVLQNINVFFVDTAADFLAFTQAEFNHTGAAWLQAHPTTNAILSEMAQPVGDVLATTFWSTMPSRFGGAGTYVKYKVIPCTQLPAEDAAPQNDPNYLRTRLVSYLATNPGCYQLQVQLRQPDMPLDQATVEWSETESQPLTVATINIPAQDITANDSTCENMSFTAWHTLAAHQPVGSVSKAREIIYKKLADYRRQRNGVPIAEPQ